VQNLFSLDRIIQAPDAGQLTLTIGKYYRVTGDSTQNRGVIPDIPLPSGIPLEAVGENTRETALPWDRIETTDFRPRPSLDSEIVLLNENQRIHAANDPDFTFLREDFEARVEGWNEHTVSLNIETRKAEQKAEEQARLDRINERRAALGLAPLSSIEELSTEENPVSPAEILLDQAARTVAEMSAVATGGVTQSSIQPAAPVAAGDGA